MVELTEMENGNLKIVLIDEDELLNVMERPQTERDCLFDIFERARLIGNGWSVLFNVGLTEMPAIGYMCEYADDGAPIQCEKLWGFNDYMVKSFLNILLDEHEIVFYRHYVAANDAY